MTANFGKFSIGSRVLIRKKFFRGLCTKKIKLTEKDVEEIKIPVPWGHIAGKWWGNKNLSPVLAIHGWKDNAGSFDKLIPFLNTQSVLAIDLPGHGCSSHLPEGRAYDFGEYIITIYRVKKYFNWEKISFLTHSLGSVIGLFYTSVFPNQINWIISLDCARTLLVSQRNNIPDSLGNGITALLQTEYQKKEILKQHYKLPELIEICMKESLGSITSPESASVLLKRGVSLVPGKLTNDTTVQKARASDFKNLTKEKVTLKAISGNLQRAKDAYYAFVSDPCSKTHIFHNVSEELLLEVVKNIKCPMLSIITKNGVVCGNRVELHKKTTEILRANSSYFEHHEVDGTHHAHLNNPEVLAQVINEFLKKQTVHVFKPSGLPSSGLKKEK